MPSRRPFRRERDEAAGPGDVVGVPRREVVIRRSVIRAPTPIRPLEPVTATVSGSGSGQIPRARDSADRLHAAIMSGDETMARHVFTRLARGVPLTDLCERIIAPALQRA